RSTYLRQLLRETKIRRSIFSPPHHAAPAASCGLVLLRRSHLSQKQIFCTSLEDQGIPAGADFKSFIQKQLESCEIVISLITENYYASAFCMCELGATWIKAKNFIPFIVPPLGFGDLKGVLFGMQAIRINDPAGLDQARDRILPLTKE